MCIIRIVLVCVFLRMCACVYHFWAKFGPGVLRGQSMSRGVREAMQAREVKAMLVPRDAWNGSDPCSIHYQHPLTYSLLHLTEDPFCCSDWSLSEGTYFAQSKTETILQQLSAWFHISTILLYVKCLQRRLMILSLHIIARIWYECAEPIIDP